MATIQVAMRCRPFTIEDKLGVQLLQTTDDPPTSECNLLNHESVTGDRARFAFSYSWWSAFNYKKKLKGEDMGLADDMKMMSQPDVYGSVGKRIKADLLSGSAVVMFAYGLSGSGKTFTVFGPDAIDSPDAWFKQEEPHKLWGILPNMAYEIFQEKKDDWKITMKYFQNVVDIVRDLMSPNAAEKMYKEGMKKDEDGFTDISWCQEKVLHSWEEFRKAFMSANARKAISPTQFNHQSTRGHCIMTLEVEKPMDDDPSRKQRGRLYVCDLAGTEPAGDIYYAQYKTETDDAGNKEYILQGPHADQGKTKELQDQGKKINLSLSEMAQFFMKMAEAVIKGKLKPGMSIPGCNSFFLCKYLKDTLLQAKTYLFCAIRPEVTYHKYTFATLGFAKNASVIKVQPKKATGGAATAAERKLMEELEALKTAMEEMQKRNKELEQSGGGQAGDADIEAAVAAKVAELRSMQEQSVANVGETDDQLREKYARNGMALSKLDGNTELPHFTNLDMDTFKNGVFMFIISKPEMSFGPKGDFRPPSLAVVPEHCTVLLSEDGKVSVRAGKGRAFVNGVVLKKDEVKELNAFDRLAVGSELLLLRMPGKEPDQEPPTVDQAVQEYQAALVQAAGYAEDLKEQAQVQGEDASKEGLSEADSKRIDALLAELHPKLDQAKELCAMLDPENPLEFSLALRRSKFTSKYNTESVDVGVTVTNVNGGGHSTVLSAADFNQCLSLLNDELGHMRDAVRYNSEHTVQVEYRPVILFFDRMSHSGTCVLFTEFLQYNMETDPEDASSKIYNVAAGKTEGLKGGDLSAVWTPLPGPDESSAGGTIDEVDEPAQLLGRPWTYRFEIQRASGLPLNVHETYVEYNFNGERFTSEVQQYEKGTRSPNFEYSFVHHVPCVTQEFLDSLAQPMELQIYTTPYVFVPPKGISTADPGVAERIFGDAESGDGNARLALARQKTREATGNADVPGEELSRLRVELAKSKMEKRLLLVKGLVRDVAAGAGVGLNHPAGSGVKAAAALSQKGYAAEGDANEEVGQLRARIIELEAQLVARGPVPPAGPPTGNPRGSNGSTTAEKAKIAELEAELASAKERSEKLAQQLRDLGHVPLD
eukprot:TRINITY_DN71276_c0_g1_i1.p1 TRINITY_DN71276_c0_g1~~TRINITY_DN71276_c0_g1_i1.p1  ORF type:complete len:1106 (+),score=318.64 TRINITY_DN71276_c0_g1_i1:213-3530(+)